MTKKHFIDIANILIGQINDRCYKEIEIESIIHEWTVFCAKHGKNFNQDAFDSYIKKHIKKKHIKKDI